MYQQSSLIGNFTDFSNNYWSSSESFFDSAWAQSFSTGVKNNISKVGNGFVRCVRSFGSSVKTQLFFVSIPPVMSGIVTHPVSQNVCQGEDIILNINASGTDIAYQWKQNGSNINGANSQSYNKTNLTQADEGMYTCEVSNLCNSILSDGALINVIHLTADAGADIQICIGDSSNITATGNSNHLILSDTLSYVWSPSTGLTFDNIMNPIASPVVTTDYTLTITDELGCTSTDYINVFVQSPFQNEQICLVTVDTIVLKNKIMWEKTSGVGSESFNIYKEVSTNIYNYIGNVPYDSSSYFIDINSVPESHGDKYKISVVDTCGRESIKSMYHKTMNLVISAFGSTMGLSWTPYEDESGVFVPGMYYIYRGALPDDMQLLDSITGSFTSYNDNNVLNTYYYMVGVRKPGGCNINAGNNSESFSNKKLNFYTGLNEYQIRNLSIYPNPANDKLYIEIDEKATLEIINYQGKIYDVKTLKENTNNIDISMLSSGIYTLRIKTEKGIAVRKLIKE
jgi:hypothetical protein